MGCRVITIAMTDGSQAEDIGHLVATRLGFRYVSDEIIDRAAVTVGVAREAVDAVEHSQPLIARLLQAMALAGSADMTLDPAVPLTDPSPAYRALIQQVIRELAAEGQAVIVAHGAGILLAGMAGLLRVLVTASAERRAGRLAAAAGIDAREADRRLAYADRERAAYFKRFYRLGQELPTHYDLVINTDVLTAEQAAQLLVCAAAL